MKRGILIFAFAALLASAVSSCKVIDPCPAYSSVEVEMSDAAQS